MQYTCGNSSVKQTQVLWKSQRNAFAQLLPGLRFSRQELVEKGTQNDVKYLREFLWRVVFTFEGKMKSNRHCFSLESGGNIRKKDQKNLRSKAVD